MSAAPTRKEGDDPGRLELVNDTWLICREPDCGRKYPIKEDIPVMLIEEGDQWINTPVEELPDPGPLVEPQQMASRHDTDLDFSGSQGDAGRQKLALLLISILGASLLIAGVVWFMRQGDESQS